MAAQFSFGGPIYCETLSAVPGSIPVEPFNTVSNGVIVIFGLLGLYFVAKRTPRAADLYVLCALLVATGVGSGIWHGLRDGDALFWEVRSGLFFLFALVLFWGRRLWTLWGALPALAAFYFGFEYSREFASEFLGIPGRWVAITPLVLGSGAAMVAQTYYRSREAALTGVLSLVFALTAVTFRTVDLAACEYVPFGTHFLWHGFLSAGGFMGVLTLTRLPVRAPKWFGSKQPALREAAE